MAERMNSGASWVQKGHVIHLQIEAGAFEVPRELLPWLPTDFELLTDVLAMIVWPLSDDAWKAHGGAVLRELHDRAKAAGTFPLYELVRAGGQAAKRARDEAPPDVDYDAVEWAALCGRPSEELEAAWKLYDRAKVAKGAQGEAQVPVEWDAVKWKAHWGRRIEELTREALVPQHQAPKHPWRTSDAGVDEEATEPPKLWERLLADASPKDLQFLEFWYAGVAAGIPEAEARRVAAEVTRPNSPRQAALNAGRQVIARVRERMGQSQA